MSRKARGMRTQMLLAQRWRENGLFPWATDAGPGRSGVDILNAPGLAVEVKARHSVSLLAQLVKLRDEAGLPIVVWRHDGQGEKSMDRWTVTMGLQDFEDLLRKTREADH